MWLYHYNKYYKYTKKYQEFALMCEMFIWLEEGLAFM